MKDLSLVLENNKVLRSKCEVFNFVNPPFDPEKIKYNMIRAMIEQDGIGLASTQVGLTYQFFVSKIKGRERIYFNPVVKSTEEQTLYKEGCLSFPGLYLDIKRPKRILASWFDEKGNLHTEYLDDLEARCFLHELDHLNGVLFIDKVSKLKRDIAERKRKKQNVF